MDLILSSLRSLRARPGFSLLIVALLAAGIGANTAIFGVVHAVLLKPLPYPQPGELVLARKPLTSPGAMIPGNGDMMPDIEFLAWQEAEPKSFRALAAYRNGAAALERRDGAVRVPTANVTTGFFELLGLHAWRGRLFTAEDARNGATPVAVLSYKSWLSRFDGDDAVLGTVVKVDDVAQTIIGILPPSFEFTDPVDLWRPLPLTASAPGQLRIQMVRVFGRLRPGTPPEAAQRELDGISERFWDNLTSSFGGPGPQSAGANTAPGTRPSGNAVAGGRAPAALARGGPPPGLRLPFADSKVQLMPLQEQLARQSRTTLWLLLAAVGFVLLIACTNIANLQLARGALRRRDLAVRAALGASPGRLGMEMLVENLALALAGGAGGVVLAWWGTRAMQSWLADLLPHINKIDVNLPVLAFGLVLAGAAGIGFGLVPAWRGCRVDLLETLREGGHAASPSGHRWRQGMVAFEFALALVLAINAGLLVKSIYRLYSTELGYRTADVMTASVALPRRYERPEDLRTFADRWLEALRLAPGVKQAALTDFPPLSPYAMVVLTAGQPPADNASGSAPPPTLSVAAATPDYFSTVGMALRQGRLFSASDAAGAPAVAIVNEAFVRTFHPDGKVLGRTVNAPASGAHGGGPPDTATIIGVVADARPRGFESAAQPLAFFPLAQQPRSRLSAVVQFAGDPGAVARGLVASIHRIDPGLAPDNPQTLEEQLARQTAPRRVTLLLTTTFAASAVLLAALGIFGVTSHLVTQRTREIGVRIALGADGAVILGWMFRQAGLALGAGLVAGLALAAASSRVLATVLTGVSGLDPAVVVLVSAGLALLGLAACLWPALRASRVNPVVALRSE